MVRYRGLEPRAARVSDEYSVPTELIAHICHKEGLMTMWHPEEDSNPHLAVLETGVLAIKLSGHMEERVGFEPTELCILRFSRPPP